IDPKLRSPLVAKTVVYPAGDRVHNHSRLTVTSTSPPNDGVVSSKVRPLSRSFPQPSSESRSVRIAVEVNRRWNALINSADRKVFELRGSSPLSRADNSASAGQCFDYVRMACPTREH